MNGHTSAVEYLHEIKADVNGATKVGLELSVCAVRRVRLVCPPILDAIASLFLFLGRSVVLGNCSQ